jgi:hypothetical protein
MGIGHLSPTQTTCRAAPDGQIGHLSPAGVAIFVRSPHFSRRDPRISGFPGGVCPPTEAVDVGHSDSSTAGGSGGPGVRVVRSAVSAAVSSRSASAAASSSQAGSLPGDSRIALLIASRAVDASLHPLVPLLRASQNHVQELPRLRPRISWRATSTSPRGVTTVTASDRLRTALPAGISFRSVPVRRLAALAPERCFRLKPKRKRGNPAGHESTPTGTSRHPARPDDASPASVAASRSPALSPLRSSSRRPRIKKKSSRPRRWRRTAP